MESLFFDKMTLSWDLDLLMADALRYNMPFSASNMGRIRPPRDHHLLLHWTTATNIHTLSRDAWTDKTRALWMAFSVVMGCASTTSIGGEKTDFRYGSRVQLLHATHEAHLSCTITSSSDISQCHGYRRMRLLIVQKLAIKTPRNKLQLLNNSSYHRSKKTHKAENTSDRNPHI
jgi:hypothetical protein